MVITNDRGYNMRDRSKPSLGGNMKEFALVVTLIMMVSSSFAMSLTDTTTLNKVGTSFKIQKPLQPNKNDVIVGYTGVDLAPHTLIETPSILA